MLIVTIIVLLFAFYYTVIMLIDSSIAIEETLILIVLLLIICLMIKSLIKKHKINKIIGQLDEKILTDFLTNDGKNVETLNRKKEIAQQLVKQRSFLHKLGDNFSNRMVDGLSEFVFGKDEYKSMRE